MQHSSLLRRFYFPLTIGLSSLTLTSVVLSCSKDKHKSSDDKKIVSATTRKEMLKLTKVSDQSKSSLKSLLGSKFFLSDGTDSPTGTQIGVSIEALDQVSKVALEQTTEFANNEPVSQRFACSETKAVGEGLLVFSVALKKSQDAPSEEKEVIPVLQEVSKDLIEVSKQESCQQAPEETQILTPSDIPKAPSTELQLTETKEQELAHSEPNEPQPSPTSTGEQVFDPAQSKPFQFALSEYVISLKADDAIGSLVFVGELDLANQSLSKPDLKESDLEKACGLISSLRVPIAASLNHPEIGEKAQKLLNNAVCK
jgi:hypothetical protein